MQSISGQTTESSTYKRAYINGKIYTVNPEQPYVDVVITQENKILFTGSRNDAEKYIDNSTEIIDLRGKLMLPGFIDNHVHFIKGGFHLLGINLRDLKSKEEFRTVVKKYVEVNSNKWITGGDWNHESWKVADLPTKEWIDEFTPNTPVFVMRLDHHMGLANSYALKLAGITENTPDPDGGLIVRDKQSGEPTGILKDNAMDLINNIIPNPSEAEYESALNAALEEAKKNGFTSVQDITRLPEVKIYQKFEKQNKLTTRVYSRIPIENIDYLLKLKKQRSNGNNKLKFGSLKAFADGSLGASTALFFEPYSEDESNYGLEMDIIKNGKLKQWALQADKNKVQLSIHAIGDKANSIVLTLFYDIIKSNPGWDRRFRIEHAQHVRFEDIRKFSQFGVIASVQPIHLLDDGNWAEKRVGKERLAYSYAFKSFLEEGVKLSFGSDWPIGSLNAIEGIYAVVTRRTTDGKNPGGWMPSQKITVEEAIKCYTINDAYASYEENIKGSIETGKLADFVVLDEDILTLAPEKIKDVKIEKTIFDGEIIYSTDRNYK